MFRSNTSVVRCDGFYKTPVGEGHLRFYWQEARKSSKSCVLWSDEFSCEHCSSFRRETPHNPRIEMSRLNWTSRSLNKEQVLCRSNLSTQYPACYPKRNLSAGFPLLPLKPSRLFYIVGRLEIRSARVSQPGFEHTLDKMSVSMAIASVYESTFYKANNLNASTYLPRLLQQLLKKPFCFSLFKQFFRHRNVFFFRGYLKKYPLPFRESKPYAVCFDLKRRTVSLATR